MATTILDKEITKDTNAVVNEAVHAAAEASRRTAQSTQDAERIARDLLAASTEAGRKLFAAYTTGVTAGIKATFEVQNAGLVAASSLFAAINANNRTLDRQTTEATHQAQQATLEVWQAGMSAVEKLASNAEKA